MKISQKSKASEHAGEILSDIGHKISDAKDSVTGFVKDEAVVVKKAAKKIARIVKKAVKKSLYGPTEAAIDKSWKPGDAEK